MTFEAPRGTPSLLTLTSLPSLLYPHFFTLTSHTHFSHSLLTPSTLYTVRSPSRARPLHVGAARQLIAPLERVFVGQVSAWVGIQTGLHCILSDRSALRNGGYYSQHRSPYGAKGGWPHTSPNSEANDDELAAGLWDRTAQLVGSTSKSTNGFG